MTRKLGRPPLPRDGTMIRRLPLHATDDEYNALMQALHADTRERFVQIDGAVNGYNIHVDEIAAERDELLQVLSEVREWRGDKPNWVHDMIDEALAKYDAVTGVTPTQEDSDE